MGTEHVILLVTGHQASGKSTLGRVLTTHPRVTVLADFGVFPAPGCSRRDYVRGLRLKWRYPARRRPLSPWFAARFLLRLGWRTGVCGSVSCDDVGHVLHAMFPEAEVVGDVANRYVHLAAEQAENPRVKTIVVHRDGRDVAATIARRFRGRWRHLVDDPEHQHFTSLVDTAEKVAHHWVDAVRLSDELRGPVLTVRYEDLVREPEAVLREVGDWLDVDPERFDHGGLHTDEVGIHRSELSDADARAVVDIAGATMARLGYEVP